MTIPAGMWEQVHKGLRAFILKRVSNDAEADDILQDVFLRVHQHLDQLQAPDRLLSWMFQITRHVIIDHYRSSGRRRESSVGLAADLEGAASSDLLETMPNEIRTELSGCLRPMLEKLPLKYREAVNLVELEGLTNKEAASRLGISVAGMKSRVQRGRRHLKKMLDDCCLIELDSRRGVSDFELRHPDACR
ncbi:RNA polymerase sigma factor SigZ [Petrachloros mirabilis]